MSKRLFIFITGQYRTFWHSWNNLVEKVIKPATSFFDIYVYVGMDQTWKSPGHLWQNDDRHIFQTHLRNEWDILKYPQQNLVVEWIDYNNHYFHKAIASLQHYRDNKKLDPYWFDYLVHRSGSCIEYAQIAQLYDIVCSQYTIQEDDLMMRTRTDILLRHSFDFHSLPPNMSCSTKEVFENLFPTSQHFESMQELTGREVSIFHSSPVAGRWIITLRKNLVYILPLKAGYLLLELVQHYGDWDTLDFNNYWFNAESQFRGCFRCHHFTLWEYSQDKDECYGNFDNLPSDFPIYAIYR
jgi:hypothetical protein